MYDGNFWNGGCLNPDHGHPVPYTFEDHIRANVDLAARIHAKYPGVLIEMHDMIAGGSPVRHTPLYYTYGESSSGLARRSMSMCSATASPSMPSTSTNGPGRSKGASVAMAIWGA